VGLLIEVPEQVDGEGWLHIADHSPATAVRIQQDLERKAQLAGLRYRSERAGYGFTLSGLA
jgi:hypothetical protein